MSTISQEEIALLRENAQKEVELLEVQLGELREKLAETRGRLQAYELLLQGAISDLEADFNGVRASVLPSVRGGGFRLNLGGEELASVAGVNEVAISLKEPKKKRAQRATKAEMERRRKVVAEVFFVRGDLTPKDLKPLVDMALGEPMEPHLLRAVLRRFDNTFGARAEHGLWGLTEAAKEELASFFNSSEEKSLSEEEAEEVELTAQA
jgi:hypothetical protein